MSLNVVFRISRSFAPASVANVAVGFDSLGFAVPILGDIVSLEKKSSGISIRSISGANRNIPTSIWNNTASRAIHVMMEREKVDFGVHIDIEKGIPLSSGLGGSAASAVAAVHALNQLLDSKIPNDRLLKYAIEGEFIASAGFHGDNVAASLYGGLTLYNTTLRQAYQLPIPNVSCVVIHPQIEVETKFARAILDDMIQFRKSTSQAMNFATFVHLLHTNDYNNLHSVMHDIIVEPQRVSMIPGFNLMKSIAIYQNAISFNISGAGPSCFAWFNNSKEAHNYQNSIRKMEPEFEYKFDSWVCEIDNKGARSLEVI